MRYYPSDTLARFEFPAIIDRLKGYCRSEKGKMLADELQPSLDKGQIELELDQTQEFKAIRENGLSFPDYHFPNVERELQMLSIPNAVLEGKQLIKLRQVTEVALNVIRFLTEKQPLYPSLFQVIAHLDRAKGLVSSVNKVLEPNGLVKSNASKELSEIRADLAALRMQANKVFDTAVRKYRKLGWLREFDESFYNDRRVLAVTAENKRKITGTLHGLSETGGTAFIEPGELVGLNNDIFETEQREQKEVYRILTQLTHEVRQYYPILVSYEFALGYLDFTQAKAELARELHACKPILQNEQVVRLFNAYHPVLFLHNKAEGKRTVPTSVEVSPEHRVLIISGPNAGGKSIALKTVGLLQLMLQSGLLIPAEEWSEMAIFDQLFVDIGDDQSIAYELSTYSSRLQKMKHFLLHANTYALFFIDEFGTGSDPELGGAMAETILEDLVATRAYGLITTHYANIKIQAEEHPNMRNGCMLFDEETLLPKYQLSIGQPGSSYTFEVAQKIGLPAPLIDRAKQKLDQRKVKLDKLLITLQTKKNLLNKETHLLQQAKSRLRQEVAEKEAEAARFVEREAELNFIDNKKLIEKGKKYEALLAFWERNKDKKEVLKRIIMASEKERTRAAKKAQHKTEPKLAAPKSKKRKAAPAVPKEAPQKPIQKGDEVRLATSRQKGTVQEINKDKATVLFGMMKTIVPVANLRHISSKEPNKG